MKDTHPLSRMQKYRKRQEVQRKITILMIAFVSLIIIYFVTKPFFKGEDYAEKPYENEHMKISSPSEEENSSFDHHDENENSSNVDNPVQENEIFSTEQEIKIDESSGEDLTDDKTIEDIQTGRIILDENVSEDENVLEAYLLEWEPIGTIQVEPHVTDYANGSQDRLEIELATSAVTGIEEDKLITWWVGNGGDQKVIATVSEQGKDETYRIYLSWIANEGWKPTRLEKLKENEYQ